MNFDAKWFEQKKGFYNKSWDVTTLKSEVFSIKKINWFFGLKRGKNGWKYDLKTSSEMVTGTVKADNKQFILQFARAIVVEPKNIQVIWVA